MKNFKVNYPKASLVLSILETVVVVVLESLIAYTYANKLYHDNSDNYTLLVYFIIFISSQLFQVVLVWDALRHQNTIQIIALMLFNLSCFCYSLIQYHQLSQISGIEGAPGKMCQNLTISIAVIMFVFFLLYLWVGYGLYREFGWNIYKRIGADVRLKSRYRTYQIFLTLVKLDVFFFLGFCIQFLVLVLGDSDPETPITIASLPIIIITLVLAIYCIRRENRVATVFFLLGLCCGAGYFIFKLIRIQQKRTERKYKSTIIFLSFFASLSLVMIFITIIMTIQCYLNFGKGLKSHCKLFYLLLVNSRVGINILCCSEYNCKDG
ncbi:hypothetical protein K493DRAFT_273791 [Basidiobolus meristosporus CBS 931.73]|uniref:DUF7789 domain-containing protein n=1 Tax=Basidiobolus meristosporus CBS 931.73 TaxID=1314790 RepID=A0A1Y1ZA20_9FUNG|nr:hypothetical protein K493DRAFT_273791 [Basidiobolus meristosporus CBS 931.73]|eukprot:ORY07120.1 hypothetical protein K493DRAFT_273791 [Basidiobolus meristosporus CBS 931.73]